MERGNVLVIGNSGVGKSTLINAVLGEEQAATGWGTKGTTEKLKIHESDKLPFRIIDTVGFEPTLLAESKAILAVKKWSKNSAKEGKSDTQINVIWFCVEGTSSKLFPKYVKALSKATSMWGTVPVIVVITKSYSVPDREKNIEMVHNAFAKQKKYTSNLRKVIPVVADTFVLNDTAFAASEGIPELIDATNELMPEGIKAGAHDIASFKLMRMRVMAHSLVGASTTGGAVVGAVPVPFADAMILAPLEIAMINALSRIYGINKNEGAKLFIDSIVKVGTVGAVAKLAISSLKAIPGVNSGASVLNAIIAGSIVAALGQASIYAFEQIYLGKKSVNDIDWVEKLVESKLTSNLPDVVKNAAEKINENADGKTIAQVISDIFTSSQSEPEKES